MSHNSEIGKLFKPFSGGVDQGNVVPGTRRSVIPTPGPVGVDKLTDFHLIDSRSLEQKRAAVREATLKLADTRFSLPSNVSVVVDLGPHGKADHLGPEGRFEAMVKNADIYIDETFGWDDKIAKVYNKIAKGDPRTYQQTKEELSSVGPQGEFVIRVLGAIYDTRKPVGFIDVRSDDPLYHDVDTLMPRRDSEDPDTQMLLRVQKPFNLDDGIALWAEFGDGWAIATNYRDAVMLSRLGPKLREIIRSNPKLSQKDDVRVLLRLGTLHHNVYTQLREISVDPLRVTAEFGLGTPIFPETQQYRQARMLGIDVSPEDKKRMFVRTVFNEMITPFIAKYFSDKWEQLDRYGRYRALQEINDMLSPNDMWDMVNYDPSHTTDGNEEATMKVLDIISQYFSK